MVCYSPVAIVRGRARDLLDGTFLPNRCSGVPRCRVPGWPGLGERGCQQDQEGPLGLAEVQRGGQRRVGFEHDVDAPRELVAGEVEGDVSRDIGEHLCFEYDCCPALGSEQHCVGLRGPFQPRARRLRLLFEVRDRGALAQVIAEPGAVAAR